MSLSNLNRPEFGHTGAGVPVHARTHDHLRSRTLYERFNKKVAVAVTQTVGSMTCAYAFCVLALLSLPAILSGFEAFRGVFPAWLIKPSIVALVAWVAQTFLQLVLLSVIMVGQQVQSDAADARAAKTFEDVEKIINALDLELGGSLREVRDDILAAIVRAAKNPDSDPTQILPVESS